MNKNQVAYSKVRTLPKTGFLGSAPTNDKKIPLARRQYKGTMGRVIPKYLHYNDVVVPLKVKHGNYRCITLWPDCELRYNDPLPYTNVDYELLGIIRSLLKLNRTGVYSSFFTYWANIGQMEISLYQGRWNHTKTAFRRIMVDCRRDPLWDLEREKEISADGFEQELILLTQ